MKRIFLVLFSTLVLLTSTNAISPGDEPVFVQEFIGQIDFVKGRLIQLAEAMPDDKYNWTPAEGVRTVGEVYLHVAETNYYLIAIMKGVKSNSDKEKGPSDKKTALSMLEKSFEAVKVEASKLTEADLNKEVEAFGMKFSLRSFMISMLGHSHEHLGQSIAYARMNGVVPPWSKKEE